ncbi:oligosaccharide translocation protein rft1 [Ophiostoma piceae UAMH 11346]|uniref:Man(5)GlcNAc(2)-PP-dolichol translocation protein RFT1 n=1 Tax=Ophiostoma piceae (strain UAMH 11346) TaxID=1262450 RepID=S3CUU2_OPHP1|nr:oligosaccharide translocation protein rft1 [Ophiostoma piceae UAMH 11346]
MAGIEKQKQDAPASSPGPAATVTGAPAAPSAVRGASLLIILQVASRAATFIANQLLLRFLTAELLGVATQLEVYYLSVLFFARESLRVAIQRQGGREDTKKKDESSSSSSSSTSQSAVNMAYVSVLLGALVALLLGWSYQTSVQATSIAATPYLFPSLYLYAVASAVELWSEPAFVVLQLRLQFGARAAAESVATVLRCATTLGAAVLSAKAADPQWRNIGVLPFALGQLAYGVGLLAVYSWHGIKLARRDGFSLVPKKLSPPALFAFQLFDRPTLNLARSMAVQSVVKHLLTQGDTLLVGILSTTQAQGIYALANNYGGLAARLLFQPIEESSRSYFSRLLAGGKDNKTAKDKTSETAPTAQAARDLQTLLKLYLLLSLVITAIGPAASAPFLGLVTGPRWAGSGAAETLAAYMWYIPLLAVNGVTEAFVASVATETQVYYQSVWMGLFSLVFAGAGYVCLHVLDGGAVGLVVANIINMTCRIVWCVVFISKYFSTRGSAGFFSDTARTLLPHPASSLAAVVTNQAVQRLVVPAVGAMAQIIQLVKILVVAVPLLLTIAFFERRFFQQCYSFVRGGGQATA